MLAGVFPRSYEVTVHNGMHGLGLVLTEVVPGSVFVTKFTAFPGDAVNPAQQEGRIRLGDQIIGLNDVPVMGWPLSRIISEVQKVPRGVGESGAMVNLHASNARFLPFYIAVALAGTPRLTV